MSSPVVLKAGEAPPSSAPAAAACSAAPPPAGVVWCLTGFGPFHGVPDNPSAALVEAARPSLPPHSTAAVLRVAWASAAAFAAALPPPPAGARACCRLHVGVDARGCCFRLERQALNALAFRCPDEDGCCPPPSHPGRVLASRPLGAALRTTLDVGALVAAVRAALGPSAPVEASDDAGGFVCNALYAASLAECESRAAKAAALGGPRTDEHALFLHIPPLERVPLAEQLRFLAALMAAVEAQLSGRE